MDRLFNSLFFIDLVDRVDVFSNEKSTKLRFRKLLHYKNYINVSTYV